MDEEEYMLMQQERFERDLAAITAHYQQTGMHPLHILSALTFMCAHIAKSDPEREEEYLDFSTHALRSKSHIIIV